MSVFIDTNVLLYSVAVADIEQPKRAIADVILERSDCVLSIQVINEFVWQATHARQPHPITPDTAFELVRLWRRYPVIALDLRLHDLAVDITRRTGYSWWDSLIVAAAITAGCDTLLTEDLQHGRVIDGVRIENPFRDLA